MMVTCCGFGDLLDPAHREVCLTCGGYWRRQQRKQRFKVWFEKWFLGPRKLW